MSKELRKIRIGRVISTKMKSTAIVSYQWKLTHPIYKKAVRKITKFYVHDDQDSCRIGDLVRIEEIRPISKQKRWRVLEILERREVAEVRPIDIDQQLFAETVDRATDVEPKPQSELEVEIETQSQDGELETKPEAKAKAEPKSKAKAKAEPKVKATLKAKADPKAKAEPKSKAKAAPKAKADPKANIGSDSGNEEGSGELVTDDSTQTKLGKDSI